MSARYLLLDLDEVQPGMHLFGAVLDSKGETLLPDGAKLSEQMLTSLRRRGLTEIPVVNTEYSEVDEKVSIEQLQIRLSQLFRNCADQSASNALMKSVMTYRLEKCE
jgi:hypothetical protein